MKKKIFLFTIFLINNFYYSQIGIKTSSPLSTLHIAASDINNPKNTDGVIIPRVTTLNTSESKETGLLVFLDYDDPLTETIEKGFYYWNGSNWIPFYSSNKILSDRTIVVAQCKNMFDEGAFTTSTGDSDIRNLGFKEGTIKPITSFSNFSINTNGALVVNKKGYYAVTGIVSMNVAAVNAMRRDSFEFYLTVNGINSAITTVSGFPNQGLNYSLTNNTTLSGALYLNVGDTVKYKINRFYKGNFAGTGSVTTSPVESMSNITLRYMGDF